MKKTTIIALAMAALFVFSVLVTFYTRNFSIIGYPLILLFATGLSLVLVNKLYLASIVQAQVAIVQPADNKLSRLILLLINTSVLFFISWLIVRSSALSFFGAAIIFSIIMLAWLLFPKLITGLSISNIVLVAIAIRFVWGVTVRTEPISDFNYYWIFAQKMLTGFDPFQTKAPFVVMFYGGIYYLTGKNLWGVYLANSLLAGLQVWLVYKITRFVTPSQLSAKTAAILYTLYPISIFYSSTVSSEMPMITMTLAATYLLCKKLYLDSLLYVENYQPKNFLLLIGISLFIVAAYLSRNTGMLLLYMSILVIFFLSTKKMTQRLLEILALIVFFIIFISPQIISNYKQYGDFSITSMHMFGVSLLSGTSRESYGAMDVGKLNEVLKELGYAGKNPQDKAVLKKVSQRAQEKAIKDILANKMDFLKFTLTRKFNRMWVGDAVSLAWSTVRSEGFGHGKNKKTFREMQKITDQYYLGLWVLAAFSTILAFFRRNLIISIMGSFIILIFLLHVFVEVQPRYHMPVMPFVCSIGSYLLSVDCMVQNLIVKKYLLLPISFLGNIFKLRKQYNLYRG